MNFKLVYRGLVATGLALLLSAPLAALADETEPRATTHEDIWLVKRISAPVISPDGHHAVVSVTEPAYDKDDQTSDLWLIALDGSQSPRQLTSTPGGESGVDWSPDGSKIAFSAKRSASGDEAAQIYVLDMAGPGEAVRITDFPTGASRPKWSPDGDKIAFQSSVWADTEGAEAIAERKKEEKDSDINVSSYEMFPIRNWDHWRDEKQTRLFVQVAKSGAEPADLMFGSELVGKSGYDGGLQAEWTPDGKGLVVTATENLDQAVRAPVNRHLYLVPAEGGEARALTEGNFSCSGARFSPDGDFVYCSYTPVNEWVYNHTEIARAPWQGSAMGDLEILTADFDRSVNNYDFSGDGKTIYITALEHGRARLFSLPAEGGQVSAINSESSGVYSGVAGTSQYPIALWESSTRPVEVVEVNPGSGQHETLTDFNDGAFEGVDRPEFREFWFTSGKGREIHNWIILPPNFDESKKYPLVLNIHGGPFSSSLDADHVRWSPHLLAAPGYVVLQTDYTGSVGYGAQFSRNIEGDPLATPGEELIEAMDEAIERFDFIDADRLAATGASYGGHLVNWLLATSDRFDALIGHAGLISLEGQWSTSDSIYHRERINGGPPWGDSKIWAEQSPATYADNFSTPTMLTIGELDYRVPINETIAAWSYLQRKQVPSRLLVFHDANHWIMKGPEARHFWEETHDWLDKYLGDSEED